MAHTTTVTVDADLVRPVVWVPTGFASAWHCVADGSIASPVDSTYVQNPFDFQGMLLELADVTASQYLNNDVAITQIRARVRGKRGSNQNSLRLQFQHASQVEKGYDDWQFGTSFANYNGWWRTTDPYGKPWTKGIVQYLGVVLYGTNAVDVTVSELEVQIEYVLPPATVVASPSGGTVGTANPEVTWTRSHDEGRSQSQFQVRLFDDSVYTRGDFDPDTSDPIAVFSGKVASAANAWTVDRSLVNGTNYVAAVRTAVTVNGVALWSPWDVGDPFLVQFDTPATPTMTVTAEPTNGRVKIDLAGIDNLLTTHEADGERETGTGSWDKVTTNMTVALSTTQAERGTHSIALTKTTSAGDMTAGPDNLALAVAGEKISAAVRFRCSGNARQARVTLTAYDASGSVLASTNGSAVTGSTSGWTTAKVDGYTLPANTVHVGMTVTILSAGTSGEVHYIDSAVMARGATAPAWTRGGLWTRNLLTADDSTIESTVGSWVAGNTNTTVTRSTTVGGQDGAAALRLAAGAGLSGVSARTDPYTVLPGASYIAIAYGRAGSGSASAAVGVEFYDTEGLSLGADFSAGTTISTGSWTAILLAATAPAGAATARLIYSVNGALANGSLWYGDAFSLARYDAAAFSLVWSRGQDSTVTTWMVVEASDDGGTTWSPIRDGDLIIPSTLEKATIYDYEIPPGVARQYRARVESQDPVVAPAPSKIASANTATQSATVVADHWWLKSTADPTTSLGFSSELVVRKGTVNRSMDERAGRFDGVGSRYPTFVTDAIGGQDGGLTCRVYESAWPAFLALITQTDPLLLVDPIEQAQFYVKLTGRQWDEGVVGAGAVREVKLDYVEVARP